jgi:hypothetical protein
MLKGLPAAGGGTPGLAVTGMISGPNDPTVMAIRNFQQKCFGWQDGVVDPQSRTEMLLRGRTGADAPTPVPADDLPDTPPYSTMPPGIRTLLVRSYRERDGRNQNLQHGFTGSATDPNPQQSQTLKEVVDRLMQRTDWPVLEEIHNRCQAKIPGLWARVRWLSWFYRYESSRGIWCCLFAEQIAAAHASLKQSPNFCSDMLVGHSKHQKLWDGSPLPSQCYRELNVLENIGLHVCVVATSAKASTFGEWHNIHIDPHQIGGGKGKKCTCWYAKVSAHMSDVGRGILDSFMDQHGRHPVIRAALIALGVNPDDRGQVYQKMMQVFGDYDTLVDMADHPEKYPAHPLDIQKKAKLEFASLYKSLYLEHMPPQFQQ